MKNITIVSQFIVIMGLLLSTPLIIMTKIPGYGQVCDAEQFYFVIMWGVFLMLSIGLLMNSIGFYISGHWKKYRRIVIISVSSILLLVFSLRTVIMAAYFGTKPVILKNDYNFIKMQLFDNGKFFIYSYDTSCESENTGTYTLNDEYLNLNYRSEQPKYIGTQYKIKDNEFLCMDCKQDSSSVLYRFE